MMIRILPLLAFLSCLTVENSPYDTARGGSAGFFLLDALASHPGTLTRTRFFATTDNQSLLESTGDGQWRRVDYSGGVIVSGLAHRESKLLATGPGSDVYYTSTDSGLSWSTEAVPLGASSSTRIAACGNHTIVTANVGAASFGVSTSLNGGGSWNGPVTIVAGTPSSDLAHCPVSAQGGCSGFCLASGAGLGTNVTAYSTDGSSWTPIAGLPAGTRHGAASGKQGILIGANTGAIFHSSGDPASFTQVDTELSYSGHIVHTGDAFVYVSAPGTIVRLRRSLDPASSNWTQTDVDFVVDPPTINAASAASGVVVLVGSRSGAAFVMRSTDHGVSWQTDDVSTLGATTLTSVVAVQD